MSEIRRVGPDYAETLAVLCATTFAEAYREEHSAEDIRAYCAANYTADAAAAALADPDTVCKVAFGKDGAAVGYYLLKHHDCPVALAGGSSELKQIYILAREFGSGVGRSLFDDAVDCVRDAGRRWIWLSVSDRNHRAQAFYRKLAFEPVGAGPVLEVGSDRLTSTMMAREA